jgi:hypothetical protein
MNMVLNIKHKEIHITKEGEYVITWMPQGLAGFGGVVVSDKNLNKAEEKFRVAYYAHKFVTDTYKMKRIIDMQENPELN